MDKQLADDLQEFLESATGKLTVTINGMVPNVKGDCNDAGAILAAFSGLKLLETQSGKDFDEILSLMQDLQQVMNYKIYNRNTEDTHEGPRKL